MRKLLLACASALALTAPLMNAPAHGETLEEAVAKTLSTNPEIGQARASRNAAAQDVKAAFGGYLPQVDLVGRVGYENTNSPSTRGRRARVADPDLGRDRDDLRREGTLTVSQLLFDGFGTPSRIQRFRFLADSAAHSVRDRAERVGLLAVEAYIEILRARAIVKLSEENIAVHRRFLSQVEERTRSGRGREADLVQARGRLAFAESTYIQNQGRLRDAESQYAQVIGDFPTALSEPNAPVDRVAETAAAMSDLAKASNPALAAAASRIDAAERLVAEAQSPFYPRLTIEGQGTVAADLNGVEGQNNSGSVLAVLRQNLYRGGSDLASTRAAKERQSEAREALATTQRAVDDDVRVSHNAYVTQKARVAKLKDYAAASERVRDAYEQQFRLGERSLFDLLDSENELFNARVNLVSAQYAESFGVYQTLAAAGLLIPTLGLPLPEEAAVPR